MSKEIRKLKLNHKFASVTGGIPLVAGPLKRGSTVPIIAAVAVRKEVASIGHFPTSFCLQSLQFILFVRSNQEKLHLKIREK